MTHEALKNSLSAYSLGALDDDDRIALEAHLKEGCDECSAILKEMQVVVTDLALSVDEQAPPEHLKERILQAVEPQAEPEPIEAPVTPPATAEVTPVTEPVLAESPQKTVYENALVTLLERGRARWMRLSLALTFAVIALLVASGLYVQSLRNQIEVLDSQAAISSGVIEQLRVDLAEKERIINMVQSPEIRIVDLQGQPVSPSAKGRVLWNPVQNTAVFYAFDLPAAPSDKDYQLWMLRGNTPVDAGVFSVTADGSAVYELATIPDSENLSAFAVTLEDKGGVPQPTGDMYLLGAGG